VNPIEELVRRFRTIMRPVCRLGWQWWLAFLVVGLLAGAVALGSAPRGRRRVARAILAGSLAFYVALVFSVTVLGRKWRAPQPVNAELLSTWAARLSNASMRYELVANALMLLPVGLLLPAATGWGLGRCMAACLALSVSIEAAQLVLSRGTPEASDVALNLLGALAGYGLHAALRRLSRRLRRLRGRVCDGKDDGSG
jgi:VanZ family protein